jgi:CheY-like chemotaxis protein
MGGELDCISAPGEGSCFTLTLPLDEARAAARDQAPASPALAGHTPRVLLADDHPVNRKVAQLILASAGIELTAVEDGQAACEAFRADAFDVVLMDMQMPVMDGVAAVQAIRAIEAEDLRRGRARILMVSANAFPEHVEAGGRAGADGHLAKPFTADALIRAVREDASARPGDRAGRRNVA